MKYRSSPAIKGLSPSTRNVIIKCQLEKTWNTQSWAASSMSHTGFHTLVIVCVALGPISHSLQQQQLIFTSQQNKKLASDSITQDLGQVTAYSATECAILCTQSMACNGATYVAAQHFCNMVVAADGDSIAQAGSTSMTCDRGEYCTYIHSTDVLSTSLNYLSLIIKKTHTNKNKACCRSISHQFEKWSYSYQLNDAVVSVAHSAEVTTGPPTTGGLSTQAPPSWHIIFKISRDTLTAAYSSWYSASYTVTPTASDLTPWLVQAQHFKSQEVEDWATLGITQVQSATRHHLVLLKSGRTEYLTTQTWLCYGYRKVRHTLRMSWSIC